MLAGNQTLCKGLLVGRDKPKDQPTKKMKKELKAKITALLALDSPANYMCWEDAEESILDDLTDEESEEYANEGCSMVEEWFAANEEENEEEEDEA